MNDIKGRCATLGEDAKQKYIQEAAALRAHGQSQDTKPWGEGCPNYNALKEAEVRGLETGFIC